MPGKVIYIETRHLSNNDCRMRGNGAPNADRYSLYQCVCGRYWFRSDGEGYVIDKWKPVRWYHFGYRATIKGLAQ